MAEDRCGLGPYQSQQLPVAFRLVEGGEPLRQRPGARRGGPAARRPPGPWPDQATQQWRQGAGLGACP